MPSSSQANLEQPIPQPQQTLREALIKRESEAIKKSRLKFQERESSVLEYLLNTNIGPDSTICTGLDAQDKDTLRHFLVGLKAQQTSGTPSRAAYRQLAVELLVHTVLGPQARESYLNISARDSASGWNDFEVNRDENRVKLHQIADEIGHMNDDLVAGRPYTIGPKTELEIYSVLPITVRDVDYAQLQEAQV